jgi:hypothetical protein
LHRNLLGERKWNYIIDVGNKRIVGGDGIDGVGRSLHWEMLSVGKIQ